MAINQNHADHEDAPSKRKRSKSCAHWSDLNNDVLFLVMMKLGFGDFYSFSGVCKSWRLLADSNKKRFMASRPPMSLTISTDSNDSICCYLKNFEGRKFKTIIPDFSGGDCIGLTCGYLIFFNEKTRNFCLVNPITRHQLHFSGHPFDYSLCSYNKAILVFSASISRWVFVVVCGGNIWFSIKGKGVWKHAPYSVYISDIYAFKGILYTLSYGIHNLAEQLSHLCELRLNPDPKFTLLQASKPLFSESFAQKTFVSSCDKLYVMDWSVTCLYELDLGEMKWVKSCAKKMKEYAFLYSNSTHETVVVRPESWADPRSHGRYAATCNNGKFGFFNKKMWYFPHECMNVDCIDE